MTFQSISLTIPARLRHNCLPFIMDGQATVQADPINPASIVNGVTIAATAVRATFVAYILAYGVTVRDPTYDYAGSLAFSLLAGQTPVIDNNTGNNSQGSTNANGKWTTQRGSVAQPIPTFIRIPGNLSVSFLAYRTAVSTVAQTVAFLATGIMMPEEADCDISTLFPGLHSH